MMNATAAINAYQKTSLETAVLGSDPHKLISMLFEGALVAIANAKSEISRKETAAKGQSISKAMAIIGDGLHASLDMNAGGELAQNLAALYDYMVRRLFEANVNNDIAILDEVAHLLRELQGAWDSIRPQVAQSMPNAMATAQSAVYR